MPQMRTVGRGRRMTTTPMRPSLEFDRRQAKRLLRAIRLRAPDAIARLRRQHPRFSNSGFTNSDSDLARCKLADAQLVIARERGASSWPAWTQAVAARHRHPADRNIPLEDIHMSFGPVIPILRIFDEAKAREFYVDYLGFGIDWEHRFEPDSPLYMQASKNACVLHLSEHHGDATPGSAVRVHTDELDAFHQSLIAKKYKHYNPSIEDMPWGTRDMSVQDPFGNRLTFTSAANAG
jgi:uncharacterized glyoxalase superfamily protein PhnB